MNISKFLKNTQHSVLQGSTNKYITSIAYNSKNVTNNGCFVAIKGFTVDGHNFIEDAINRGATVVFVEKDIPNIDKYDTTIVMVDNCRSILAKLSSEFYGNPSTNLDVIGITGTNGKTSVANFLNSIYLKNNNSIALLGTTGLQINNQHYPFSSSTVTTPESLELQKLLKNLSNKNVEKLIMEVSSHALDLERVKHTRFKTGVFINLSPDHLELHKTLNNYFKAKAKLFDLTTKHNVINIDDFYGKKLYEQCLKQNIDVITIGIHTNAHIHAENIEYSLYGSSFTVITPTYSLDIEVHLPGEIYVYNSLLAIACAYMDNVPKQNIKKGIEEVKEIEGRFNIIYDNQDFKIIIDFAHTEDALKNLLKTIKPFVKGKLILVFGVYADMSEQGRDKRINMGKVAGNLADLSIVTLDNPKHYDQNTIISQITEGIKSEDGLYKTILNREEAIKYAVHNSNNNDFIVIAGKGHERYQIIKDDKIYLNEEEIVLNALKETTI